MPRSSEVFLSRLFYLYIAFVICVKIDERISKLVSSSGSHINLVFSHQYRFWISRKYESARCLQCVVCCHSRSLQYCIFSVRCFVCTDVPFPLVDLVYHARPSILPSTSSHRQDRIENWWFRGSVDAAMQQRDCTVLCSPDLVKT